VVFAAPLAAFLFSDIMYPPLNFEISVAAYQGTNGYF
jgi:hypothetical protein